MNLSNITKEIEQIISEALPDANEYPSHIVEAMNYAMTAGGKRIRPVFRKENQTGFHVPFICCGVGCGF